MNNEEVAGNNFVYMKLATAAAANARGRRYGLVCRRSRR